MVPHNFEQRSNVAKRRNYKNRRSPDVGRSASSSNVFATAETIAEFRLKDVPPMPDARTACHAADAWARVSGLRSVFVSAGMQEALDALPALATPYGDEIEVTMVCVLGSAQAIEDVVRSGQHLSQALVRFDGTGTTGAVREALVARAASGVGVQLALVPWSLGDRLICQLVEAIAQAARDGGVAPGPVGNPAEATPVVGAARSGQRSLLAGALMESRHPLLVLGRRALIEQDPRPVANMARKLGAPVLFTTAARTCPPADMERWCAAWPVDVPLVNAAGAASFYALSHADLILTVQARLTEGEGYGLRDFTLITAPVYELSSGFAGGAPAEILKKLPLARDRVRESRQRFVKRVTAKIYALEKMSARIARSATRRQAPLNPAAVSHAICTSAPDDAVLLGEGNAAGMWMWSFNGMRPTLYPARMATTGLLLPWILGASRTAPTRPLWCFAGDGGLGYQPALFGALRETRANAVVFVFNNRSWSSMRLEEAVQLRGRRPGPALPERDFADLAERFDCDGIRVETGEQLQAALRQARQPLDRPLVIDIAVTRNSAPLAGMTFALAGLDGVLRPMRARLVLGLARACLSGRLPWRVPRMLLGMVLS